MRPALVQDSGLFRALYGYLNGKCFTPTIFRPDFCAVRLRDIGSKYGFVFDDPLFVLGVFVIIVISRGHDFSSLVFFKETY